ARGSARRCVSTGNPRGWCPDPCIVGVGNLFVQDGQFSIFFCVLKPIDRVRLQSELEEVMNLKEDQVLIIDLGENEPAARKAAVTLGESLDEPLEGMVVI
ncbi:MAG: CRISPR-associated endonuclease Cas2, partial [Acidobacteriales bacterium]|nr:CRISPR-associated endonuclease Cas2 [Terriglobales bacterium]